MGAEGFREASGLLKNALRSAVRRGKRWLSEGEPAAPLQYDARSAYPPLNRMYAVVTAEVPPDVARSHFTWCLLHAARLARALRIPRISVLELGVAGGNGLVALEAAAGPVERLLGVGLEIFGFDAGTGLPKPQDPRDLPNLYREGIYAMDEPLLRARLRRSDLRIGLVADTIGTFMGERHPPVGFVSVDLDLYSSTRDALRLFAGDPELLLPRVHCFFDDIMGFTFADHNGERLAIAEFNAGHAHRKLSPIHGLRHFVPPEEFHSIWTEQVYLAHVLDHPRYGEFDGLATAETLDLDGE